MTVTESGTTTPTWRPRLLGVVAATVANIVLILLAPLFGANMEIIGPDGAAAVVGVQHFALFTAVFALLGWAALAVAERLLGAARGRLVWTVVAVLFTLLSFVPSLSVGATVATEVVLVLSHVVVAAIVVPVFRRTSEPV
ncbi:DUF6069 family protein [Nocardiopsis alba]|uniref:DUF6069 family protein n=1 Tax=Nocardiopsis alba TaxID=53437 RepID=UPI00362E537E